MTLEAITFQACQILGKYYLLPIVTNNVIPSLFSRKPVTEVGNVAKIIEPRRAIAVSIANG